MEITKVSSSKDVIIMTHVLHSVESMIRQSGECIRTLPPNVAAAEVLNHKQVGDSGS